MAEGGVETAGDNQADIFRGDLVNYSELPGRIPLDSGVLDAITQLRATIYPHAQEFGAIVVSNEQNQLQAIPIGRPGEGAVAILPLVLDEDWIDWIKNGKIHQFEDNSDIKPHIVFAPKALAEANTETINSLIASGIQVRLDSVPRAVLHTHPSGNLPSGGDVKQILVPSSNGERPIEGIVTKTETFFLVPTNQTPDITELQADRHSLSFAEDFERREDEVVEHLSADTKANLPNAQPINAARYELLRSASTTYYFGLYVAQTGKTEATRIF